MEEEGIQYNVCNVNERASEPDGGPSLVFASFFLSLLQSVCYHLDVNDTEFSTVISQSSQKSGFTRQEAL